MLQKEGGQMLAPEQVKAERSLTLAQSVISQDYLSQLGRCEVLLPQLRDEEGFTLEGDVRIFRLARLVQENREAVLESAIAAYSALGAAKSSVFFYLHSSGNETTFYIGVRGQSGTVTGEQKGQLLQEVFRGHFPGSRLEAQNREGIEAISGSLRGTMAMDAQGSVTAVTGVPDLSSNERSMFIQGLERFIDAAEGKRYQALILADPVLPEELKAMRLGCERLATMISPLAKTTTAYNQSESHSVAESLTNAINEGFSETETEGTNSSRNWGGSESTTSESAGRSAARGVLKFAGAGIGLAATALSGGGLLADIVGGIGLGSLGDSLVPQKTKTEGESWGETEGTSFSTSKATNKGTSRSEGETTTDGTSQGITHTIERHNKTVEQFLKTIDYRLERIDEAHSYGGWNAAAYFIADTPAVSEALASTYMGLMRGAASGKDTHAITTWSGEDVEMPRRWLASFQHPRLNAQALIGEGQHTSGWLSPAVMVSTREAAMLLNLPRRSASTLPVLKAEPFGRSIQYVDGTAYQGGMSFLNRKALRLGCIRHLWEDMPQKIRLDREQLRTHAFVTGTTGSGKSNTLYLMLHQLLEAEIPFLVVEPAKGEYAQVFGGHEKVNCFDAGTGKANRLKLNPFRCPKELSLLEHIDRLTGIFCVCWPLYNAMPALLKDAVIVSYERAGWDIDTSAYLGEGEPVYPDFTMLLGALEDVIASAGYGERLQAEYTGALCTRVRSLTTGFSGRIFVTDETGDDVLFDKTALVDLSRVGSAETRSLIMGILVMRLVEYRQAQGEMNAPLRHVTVLEEAHNLLRADTAQGGDEQGGMIGKSVEMLTDAIAEMRTYGEGFVIVDQSPRAVHRAAIRNTGTKIALRLPDEEDRHVLGTSIGLNDEQIKEMARLENGVAVIRQPGWLEAVLCHMDRFNEETMAMPMVPRGGARLTGIDVKAFRSAAIRFLMWPWTDMAGKPDIAGLKWQVNRWPDDIIRAKLLTYIEYYEKGSFSISSQLEDDGGYRFSRFVTDLIGLRRQVALVAAKDQAPRELDMALGRLIQRSCRLSGEMQRQLTAFLLMDWAGSDHVKRNEVLARWRHYIKQDGEIT
ncbi:DUF87 domain-containing protein [Bombella sp. TMW 2.2543]|uniref:DUF87 domain-containing protein n=1 Tax=Bombella pluederhausensis TaxID=2967336 RepID=A0ABT3WKF3_9PROT|nr:DUF87 domain-containing protein [Bombella pluederhausensis]MCX5618118.1 DUF87 domain-containing protein [Bombella pluederhausensis]